MPFEGPSFMPATDNLRHRRFFSARKATVPGRLQAVKNAWMGPAVLASIVMMAVACGAGPDTSADVSTDDPIILVTDLNHPLGDPDDHIDLAVAHGQDLDVVAVILDAKPELFDGDGAAPWTQMELITSSGWSLYKNDVGTDGLLESLRAASVPVTIVSVGSLSHIAAALEADE